MAHHCTFCSGCRFRFLQHYRTSYPGIDLSAETTGSGYRIQRGFRLHRIGRGPANWGISHTTYWLALDILGRKFIGNFGNHDRIYVFGKRSFTAKGIAENRLPRNCFVHDRTSGTYLRLITHSLRCGMAAVSDGKYSAHTVLGIGKSGSKSNVRHKTVYAQ